MALTTTKTGENRVDVSFVTGDNKSDQTIKLSSISSLGGFWGRIYQFFGLAIKTPTGEFVKKSQFFSALADVKESLVMQNIHSATAGKKIHQQAQKKLYSVKFSVREDLSEDKCRMLWDVIKNEIFCY